MKNWEDRVFSRIIMFIVLLLAIGLGATFVLKAPGVFKFIGMIMITLSVYIFIKGMRVIKNINKKNKK